jgi:hypothetical protein
LGCDGSGSGIGRGGFGTVGVFPEKHEERRDPYVLDDNDDDISAFMLASLLSRESTADLKDVLEWVCHFSPLADEVLVPFAHDEVQVLVYLAGYEDIVQDAFLVLR